MKKNTTQLILPIDFSNEETKQYVKQYWKLTFSKQKKVSPYIKRMLSIAISQIPEDITKEQMQKKVFTMNVADLFGGKPPANKGYYGEVKKAFREMMNIIWEVGSVDGEGDYKPYQLINSDRDGFGYSGGRISFGLNSQLVDLLVLLSKEINARYTTYGLFNYLKLNSWYSTRMYELLSAYKHTGWWEIDLDAFRVLMDCQDKYNKLGMFLKRVVDCAQDELKDTDMAFKYSKIEDTMNGKRGRFPIIGLRFELREISKIKDKIPDKWYEAYNGRFKQTLIDLVQKWKVHEYLVVKYLPIIKGERASELVREWQLLENTDKQIKNRRAYCNKVWTAEGESANAYY